MGLEITLTKRPRSGFTLVEVVMAMGVSSLVLAALLSLYLYSNSSFVFLTNHVFMEQQNQHAMDYLSRQIRGARKLTAYSQTSLTFTDYDTHSLRFDYDPARQVLYRVKEGRAEVLLTSCSSLRFQIYAGNVQSNVFDLASTITNVVECRMVGVSWTCSQRRLGLVDSEQLQCAKILIRNANGGG